MESTPAWFCLRAQPKHEHIAAGPLRQLEVEAFLPRISFQRLTTQGPQWTTEALFPDHLFARFALDTDLRKVRHAPGVSTVLSFGGFYPTIAEEEIQALRALVQEDSIHIVTTELLPGDEVTITTGSFQGLRAVGSRVMPSLERVKVLLEFLGRQTQAEIPRSAVMAQTDPRRVANNLPVFKD